MPTDPLLLAGAGVVVLTCVAAVGLLARHWEAEDRRVQARVDAFWQGVAEGAAAHAQHRPITAPSFDDTERQAPVRYWWEGARRAAVGVERAQLALGLEALLAAEHFEIDARRVAP